MVDSKINKDGVAEDISQSDSFSGNEEKIITASQDHSSVLDNTDAAQVVSNNTEEGEADNADVDKTSLVIRDAEPEFSLDKDDNKPGADSLSDMAKSDTLGDVQVDEILPLSQDDVASVEAKKKSALKIFIIPFLILFALLIVVVGLSYWTINYVTKEDEKLNAQSEQTIGRLEKTISDLANTINATSNDVSQLESNIIRQVKSENSEIAKRLRAAEDRLLAQNKRLLSLSTTTREDWLLAEAEYLLKLASQRALIEKNSESAASLLQEADGILRDLGDPDLYALREVIQRDLTALRLVEKIDQEGIYLGLLALTKEIDSLPVLPKYTSNTPEDMPIKKSNGADEEVSPELESTKPIKETPVWMKKVKLSFASAVEKIKSSFNVVKYDESPMAMVSPQASVYVRQNLRLIIEKAQLALLREQQNIYVSSLKQAEQWLLDYFPRSEKRTLFIQQLKSVADKNIVRQVPKISESLNLLNTYIQDLHQLKGVAKPVVKAPKAKKNSAPKPSPSKEPAENMDSPDRINSGEGN